MSPEEEALFYFLLFDYQSKKNNISLYCIHYMHCTSITTQLSKWQIADIGISHSKVDGNILLLLVCACERGKDNRVQAMFSPR